MKLIVAADKNFAIGKDGGIPWRLRGDLKYFKEQTMGHAVIMGRKTLESLPGGKPLKDRVNIVLTRDASYAPEGVIVCHSIDEVLALPEANDAFVIGGESIYKAFLPHCSHAYVTKVDGEFDADTYMVNLDALDNWTMTDVGEVNEEDGILYRFTVYENKELLQEKLQNLRETIDAVECCCLTVCNDEFEADVLISLLKSCGILAFKKFGGFSAAAKIYCGGTNLGTYVFVSSAQYEEAKAIIEAPFDEDELEGAQA
ncbi:MAG: dihydrofolate reductase [Clostridia bacterium]|nr:dihydrofolate reductase [Clostridia bacterium]